MHAAEMTMTKLAAADPLTLPEPVLERILALGVRLTGLTLCHPGRSTLDAAQRLVPYLNTLPRSCAPHVSLAVIVQCPWIDANVASLSNNLWLLDVLGNKLSKAPYWRPMQYDDLLLLDKVSGEGLVDILDWWHKSDYVIGHDDPLRFASNGGHVAVLQWWLDSGLLGGKFPDPDEHSFDLLEPTRKGDMHVLNWWLRNVLQDEMDLNDMVGEAGQMDSARYMLHSFAEAIWVALQAGQMDLVDWWIEISMHYSGISDKVMSALFASGNRDLVAKYVEEYVECGGNLAESFPFVAFSGDIKYIEHCRQMLGAYHGRGGSGGTDMMLVPTRLSLYASCAGHVQVLAYLKSKGWARPSALWELSGVFGVTSNVWTFLPKGIFADSVRVTLTSTLSPLDVLAQQGQLGVMQWWGSNFTGDLQAALKDKEPFLRFVGMALANNHLALLDWLLAFTGRTALEFACRAGEVAAFRGHLSAVQWYLEKGPHDSVVEFELGMEEIIRQALIGGRFEIVEWLMDNHQEKFRKQAFHVVYEVLQDQPRAHIVEWCWKNASRLPRQYGSSIRFKLYDHAPDEDLDYDGPNAQDLWTLLGLIDAKAVGTAGKRVKFVTAVLDEEEDMFADEEDEIDDDDRDEVIKLLQMWRGYPLFLERLLAKRKRVLTFPLDLDLACEADASVAVLDWMYARNKAEGKSKWSEDGYDSLIDHESKVSLQWWEKRRLPQEPKDEEDESDFGDGSGYGDAGGSVSGSDEYSDDDSDDDWEDDSDHGDCACGECGQHTGDAEDALVADLVWAAELWKRLKALDLDKQHEHGSGGGK